MALSSAPFGGLCPQLRSLCGLARGSFASAGGHVCHTGRPGLNSTPHSRGRRRPRRETIFCGPGVWVFASYPLTPRRSRLGATPCGVSV